MRKKFLSAFFVVSFLFAADESPLPKEGLNNMLGVVILAAGKGTRMKSSTPKVMHKIAGRMMIDHILDHVKALNAGQIVIVASHDLKESYQPDGVDIVIQEEQLGTGHAVQMAIPILREEIKKVLILCGDTPLIQKESLTKLLDVDCALAVMGMHLPDSEMKKGYGRFITNQESLISIVEMKDATLEQKEIKLANAGVYSADKDLLNRCLPQLTSNNAAKEYYLTDIVGFAHAVGDSVRYSLCSFEETIGVNSRVDQSLAEQVFQDRLRTVHMLNGATLIDPKAVFFQSTTKIGQDVVIYPGVVFGNNVTVEDGVTIYQNCYLEECTLKRSAKVGPFAHLRGGCTLEDGAEVGNFVELKATHLGKKAKAKHLTYLGDCTVGEKANIGAGTITCNYNGFTKSKTEIGEGAFIGSHTALVAPVSVGDRAIIGAGSTIVENVPSDAISLSRTPQVTKPDAAIRFRSKHKKSD